ncbi:MAG TPA: hypothetical protein VL463_09155 [Kofleriaceae bacterium]|nr:hypothetical protein [Kofleriaceae bacterium]
MSQLVAAATMALRDAAAHRDLLAYQDVAKWCAVVGGVDARLERAALTHAIELVDPDILITDLAQAMRARLCAAGPLLPQVIASGGLPYLLVLVGLDDVEPPAGAIRRPLPPRVARFYWQRLRAFVAWSASTSWM